MPSCFSCFGPGRSAPPTSSYQPAVPSDYNELDREQLKELYDKSIALNAGRLIVHGIFARADTKNNNKRVYPKYLLKREVDKYEQERILKGTALGELDHPNYASRYFKCLNLANISHQVLQVQWKGNQLWGSIEILPTPAGLLLWELYSQGIKLGVSSRGWASLRTDANRKCVFVDDDFELITFDFVTEPSTKDAFLVPLQQTFPASELPGQKKCIQIAHLGHGVCGMEQVANLPSSSTLAARIGELQIKSSKSMKSQQQTTGSLRMPDVAVLRDDDQQQQQQHSRLQHLDKHVLYSHYIVHQYVVALTGSRPLFEPDDTRLGMDAMYLDREKDARNFQTHLAMFASRAHLSNQQHLMNKAELGALIMQEVARQDNGLNYSMQKRPPQGTKDFMHLAECQGQQMEDLPAWPQSQSYASVSAPPPGSHLSEASRKCAQDAPAQTQPQIPCGVKPSERRGSLDASSSQSSHLALGSNRVHPHSSPSSSFRAPRASPQPAVPGGPPRAVLLEMQLIKATLAKYALQQQRVQQQYLQSIA